MKKETNVLIGIQARTNSTRLPNKAMKEIAGRPLVKLAYDAACKSSKYINSWSDRRGVRAHVSFLIPEKDQLSKYFENDLKCHYVEGHPTDLIDRYYQLAKDKKYDYVVRITADCPLIPPFLITKCINTAITNNYDFLDNASPDYRCFFDGADVEVLSMRALTWLYSNAKEREHVCNDLRKEKIENLKYGHVFSHVDLGFVKLSVDTQKDLDLVTNQYLSREKKKRDWELKYGKTGHMF